MALRERQADRPPGAPPPAADGLAVVVVNYNTREHLYSCLLTVRQEAPAEVVVVDNASTDGSAEMVREVFPEVRLVRCERNLGYGPAANLGVERTQAPSVLLLNSDTRLRPGATTQLRAYLATHPGVGIAGPRLLNADGSWQPSCFPFPGSWGWFVENDPVGLVAGRVPGLRGRLHRYAMPTRAHPVPWVLGAALALRREAFEQAGGFDEGFFMYYEEVDLCYRLHELGWETHCCPDAEVYHVGGVSTSQRRVDMLVQNFRSTLRFYRKHYGGVRLHTWLALLRTKMWFKLLRDRTRLATVSPEAAESLREEVQAWRRSLRPEPESRAAPTRTRGSVVPSPHARRIA
ncbi:MAG: glycosyltransferase family 2 protein [Rhodothermales bacterium]|nr:glycosyltransferase family 2 protein [Rhodothermales bacterium]